MAQSSPNVGINLANLPFQLTHWSRVTLICVNKITIIGSYNGLSPGRRQVIIWTNAGILLIGPVGITFTEIWIEVNTFSLKEIHWKMSSAKWRSCCLGLSVSKHGWISRDPNLNRHSHLSMPASVFFVCQHLVATKESLVEFTTNLRFTDDSFKCIFMNENVWISHNIWRKYVLKGQNDNNTLAEIMAWVRSDDKPLSEPILSRFNYAYMRH